MYATDLDASMVDLFVGNGSVKSKARASLSLSEASYPGNELAACKIGGPLGDPENPPCARLVFTGNVSKVLTSTPEDIQAKDALFARHPSFKNYPSGHAFYVAKLNIDKIWLIDTFGGAAAIEPNEYYKVKTNRIK